MARGKQGAAAAIRRAEAAHEHIDRLTDQLVDAKAKANQFATDAAQVQVMRAQLRALTESFNSRLTERVDDVSARHAAATAELERDFADLLEMVCELVNNGTPDVDVVDFIPMKWIRSGVFDSERDFLDRPRLRPLNDAIIGVGHRGNRRQRRQIEYASEDLFVKARKREHEISQRGQRGALSDG